MTGFYWMTRWRSRGFASWTLALAAAAVMTALSASTAATTAQAQSSRIGSYGSHGYEMAPRESRGARHSEGRGSRRATKSYAKADDDSAPKRQSRRARVARNDDGDSGSSSKPKVGGGHVSWVASGGCLPGALKSAIAGVSQYGRVVVSSTHRSGGHNRSVGGASRSYHLSCQAADFRVHGNVSAAASYLRNHGSVGGFHHYGGGLFHIDTGPKRSW